MRLIVTEKPSVAMALAKVLNIKEKKDGYLTGNGYIITWCIGHLLGLAAAEEYDAKHKEWKYEYLPIIPTDWKYTVSKFKEKQLKIIEGLMKKADVETIICATDAGREGELIFRLVYNYCNCQKPIKRLWISSMEESAILNGFNNLKDGSEYDKLYNAALCRAKADWLVGINATRLFSSLYKASLSVGRVQTPTLAMVVHRENEIKNFKKEPFYTVEMKFTTQGCITASTEKFKDKQAAENINTVCNNKTVTVKSVQKQEKSISPPKLYDLTTLQREANRLFGYTAQQTLDYAQALYVKKLITYPRTDSRYLTTDMQSGVSELAILSALLISFNNNKTPMPVFTENIINDAKVTDHHAIIPTMFIKKTDISVLPSGEKYILYLIVARLISAVSDKHLYSETVITFECEENIFTTKGRTILQNGWKSVEEDFKKFLTGVTDNNSNENVTSLPDLIEGQSFPTVTTSLIEGFTTPPKHFTEDTLLFAMEIAGQGDTAPNLGYEPERHGLGTPATRAAIIEKLVKSGTIKRDKKNLLPTDKAGILIAVLPDMLKSPQLTAEWETMLKQVELGKIDENKFMLGISGIVQSLIHSHSAPDPEKLALLPRSKEIGKCPRCGDSVHEKSKVFFCNSQNCDFALWKDNIFFKSKKKKLTADIVTALLKDGRIFISGLISEKTGKPFDATVILKDTGSKFVGFGIEFKK